MKPTSPQHPGQKLSDRTRPRARYCSVIQLMRRTGASPRLIKKVQTLLHRDKSIARDFRAGAGISKLSRKYSLPRLDIEDVLRGEMFAQF